jgi:hypothetical protein
VPFADKHFETGIILKVIDGDRPRRPITLESTDPLWLILERCWYALPLERPSLDDIAVLVTVENHTNTGSSQETVSAAHNATSIETATDEENLFSSRDRDRSKEWDDGKDHETETLSPEDLARMIGEHSCYIPLLLSLGHHDSLPYHWAC